MGGISSRLTRQFYRYNAENRAHKIIQKTDPRPAPKYEKTLQHIEMLQKDMPTLKDDLSKFDPQLHDRLKQVYVTSDIKPSQNVFTKPPPLSPRVRRTSDFGFDDDDSAALGHITLKHAVQMIMEHYNSDDIKIEDLAKKYKIRNEDAENILKYYKCFNLRLSREKLNVGKFLNTIVIGNERGEILSATQFIKRIEDQKGIRDESTWGIPPLSKDIEAMKVEEQKKRALASGTSQISKLSEKPPSETKELDSPEKKD